MSRKQFRPSARHRARRLLLRALYQWSLTLQPLEEIGRQCIDFEEDPEVDLKYFWAVLRDLPLHLDTLDQKLQAVIDRPLSSLDPIECAILRIGSYELFHQPSVPHGVVINEAVELAKAFGATDSYKYVNGVLDKIYQTAQADLR